MVVFLSHVVAFYMGFWISREIFTKCFAFKNGAHMVFFFVGAEVFLLCFVQNLRFLVLSEVYQHVSCCFLLFFSFLSFFLSFLFFWH